MPRRRRAHAAWFALAMGLSASSTARADEQKPLEPAYWRAAAEIGGVIAIGTAWYVIDDRNVLDWDKPSAAERFNGKAWRFDNNSFGVNYVWHPAVGGIMYGLARANRIGVGPSFAMSALGSSLWELGIEFNEKVSINDMWVTPVAGLPIGEFFHKLGLHLAHPSGGAASRALAWTLGFPAYAHRRLDGVDGVTVAAGEEAPPGWHAAAVRYGFGALSTRRDDEWRGAMALGTTARFVSLPGYLSPTTFGRWFHDAEIAEAVVTLDVGPQYFGLDWSTEVLLAGYHAQSPHAASTTAIAVSYAYRSSQAFGFDDRQGIVGFPGLAWEGRADVGACTVSAGARAALGFGSMSAPSFALYETERMPKTVLRREGYSFGWDFKTRGDARLGCGQLELRGDVAYDRFSSIQGLDRNQEEITDDARVVEHALRYGLSAWLKAEPLPVSFGVTMDTRLRTSRMRAVERELGGYRTLAAVELGF